MKDWLDDLEIRGEDTSPEGRKRLKRYLQEPGDTHHVLLDRIANSSSFGELEAIGEEILDAHLERGHLDLLLAWRGKWDQLAKSQKGRSLSESQVQIHDLLTSKVTRHHPDLTAHLSLN